MRIPPVVRRLIGQAHLWIGLIAGTVLMVIGATGAILAFEDEWLDAWNQGVRTVTVPSVGAVALSPAALLAAQAPWPADQRAATLVVSSEPGRSAQLVVQKQPPQVEGRWPAAVNLPIEYLDPYTGARLGQARGQGFFDTVERLHRFMLMPREQGRLVTATIVSGLLVLVVSGLVIRWPRKPLQWRQWLTFNMRLRGRSFWWFLHAVVATWALPFWLVSASTGIYWGFDGVRQAVDGWLGVQRNMRMAHSLQVPPASGAPDMTAAWATFTQLATHTAPAGWREVRLRLPAQPTQDLEITWLASDAAHPRARNRLVVSPDGQLRKDERFEQRPVGQRAQAAIHPLHMGTYFGLPGRLAMMLAALCLPVIGATGWTLYLLRRQKRCKSRATVTGPVYAGARPRA